MKKLRIKHFLILVLTSPLIVPLFTACNPEDIVISPPPAEVTISGKVLAVSLSGIVPLPGATVELEDGSISTLSGEGGLWTLENVPTAQDPTIKITSEGPVIDYFPAYNTFPLSLGFMQYDLQTMDPCLYILMVLEWVLDGADINKLCVVFGAVAGFAQMEYPQEVVTLAGARVEVSPPELTVAYLSEAGLPDPSLTETSQAGAFMVFVPDATTITNISLKGELPGTSLVGPPVTPTYPSGFVVAGLVDPFYVP